MTERIPLPPPISPGLYVHVPFCRSKCAYCDFVSEAPPKPDRVALYLDALELELARGSWDRRPQTIYVGGGTPTALPAAALERLLRRLHPLADEAREWTIEANPGTVDESVAQQLMTAGVTRVSLGVQTLHEPALRTLGRTHDARAVVESVTTLRRAGFTNISFDLMLAIPERTMNELEQDLTQLLALGPMHVSAYLLTVEPGTCLAARIARGEIAGPPEDQAVAEYEWVSERLYAAGFRQYELSNWARPGYECRHNLLYWTGGDYIGVGPAAHSHHQGTRWGNFQSLDKWAEALSKGWTPIDVTEQLPPERAARERLVMWLRLVDGVANEAFRAATGWTPEQIAGDEIRSLVARGLLEQTAWGVRLAPRARLISNVVFAELV